MDFSILHGDALTTLRTLDPLSVQCIVTSPPYYGLRSYLPGVVRFNEQKAQEDGVIESLTARLRQLEIDVTRTHHCTTIPTEFTPYFTPAECGQEDTADAYVQRLVEIFREARRVLRDDGTLWLNLGDSYAPNKQLLGIPWRVALALQADGWILRSDVIWAKPNPLPESVRDRPTKSHEYVFLFAKNTSYFYDADAIAEPLAPTSVNRYKHAVETNEQFDPTRHKHTAGVQSPMELLTRAAAGVVLKGTRNKRTVWSIPTQSYSGAHFATFPELLAEVCVLASTSKYGHCASCGAGWVRTYTETQNPKGILGYVGQPNVTADGDVPTVGGRRLAPGHNATQYARGRFAGWAPTCACHTDVVPAVVLDPFSGSGTTGMVAVHHGRRYIGIELNLEYVALSHDRIRKGSKKLKPHTDELPL